MSRWSRMALPPEVRTSLVRSLFENRGTLLTGVVCHVFSYLIIFHKTADPFFFATACAFLAVFTIRVAGFARFSKVDTARWSVQEAWAWERHYSIGSLLTAGLLGLGGGYASLYYQNSFVQLACIAVTLGSMVSIVGRNYASQMAVDLQNLASCLPIIAGAVITQDIYNILLSLLFVPFGLSTRAMATNVREYLCENVLASRQMQKVVESFDTALNNMTHGLIMLNTENRIQVINRRACQLLYLGDRNRLRGCELEVALRYGLRRLAGDAGLPQMIQTQLRKLVACEITRDQIAFSDDLILEFSVSKRPEGGVVLIFQDVTARVTAERRILDMVRYDALTRLPLREYFVELVATALHDLPFDCGVGLMLLDIDGFRHVNDLRGHRVGDSLLIAVAERLTDVARPYPVGRLAGDQFVVMVVEPEGQQRLLERMETMRAELGGDYVIQGRTLNLTFSGGGLTGVDESDPVQTQEWRRRLELALFEAKENGGDALTVFTPQIDGRYFERQQLQEDLRIALAEGSLDVLYQPVYTADGTRIDRCEALARWHHVTKGHVSPAVFIPIAEELDMIGDVTRLVLARACRDCLTWSDQVSVSVNLSGQDLHDMEIVSTVRQVLEQSGLPASRLHLEITETSVMKEIATAREVIDRLRSIGISIAIDDFGTGFSSLSYLDKLAADVVKIDRSFVIDVVSQPRRFKLLQGIVNLSRQLGLEIVVEGVETEEQLALINAHHCADFVQGFLFSRPVQSAAIPGLIEQASRRAAAEMVSIA